MERINLTGEMDTFSMYVLLPQLSNITFCQPDGAGVITIPGSTRIHSLGTGISLVREWYPLAAPRAALVQALAAPHGPSQRNKSTGKGKGNSEFPFETSFASWQLCEVAVTFQERKLFQYIPSCSNFPLLISSLVSMIKPHFRWHKRLIQSYIWGL